MLFSIIILAILQGISEFLPISSSGHLVLLNQIFKIDNDFLLLSVILHIATLFSVIFVLWKEIKIIIKKPFNTTTTKLIVASLPTVVIVAIFKKILNNAFSGAYLPFCFMLTALTIVLSEFLSKNNTSYLITNKQISIKNKNNIGGICDAIDYKTALFMGIMQGVAVLPGISRSGFTICAGLMAKKDRKEVAKFSFLMSIPIIIASLLLEVYEYISSGTSITISVGNLLIGFFVALIVGVISAKFMLKLVSRHTLYPFAIYLIIISILSFFVVF